MHQGSAKALKNCIVSKQEIPERMSEYLNCDNPSTKPSRMIQTRRIVQRAEQHKSQKQIGIEAEAAGAGGSLKYIEWEFAFRRLIKISSKNMLEQNFCYRKEACINFHYSGGHFFCLAYRV